MPANYRIEVQKKYQEEEWANTWLVQAVDMDDAVAIGNALVSFERSVHASVVTITYIRVSTLLAGDRTFRHVAINLPGTIAQGTVGHLPLYCTVRIDLNTANSDPARKYIRMPIAETDQHNGQFTTQFLADVQGFVDSNLFLSVAGDNIFTPTGDQVVSGTVHPYVQMRQLHRRKRPAVT